MKSFLTDSVFLGVVVSLLTYEFGLWFKKKVKIAIFNPLLISIILKALDYCKENDITLYCPWLIGCGLANGDWNIVFDALKDTDIVFVKLKK